MTVVFKITRFDKSTDAATQRWLRAIYVVTASALASHRKGHSELAERALDMVDALTDMALQQDAAGSRKPGAGQAQTPSG